jgi:ATP-dependent RNA helicase DDX41
MATASSSRRRAEPEDEQEPEDDFALPADYKPYVPVAKRRAQLKSTLTGKQQQAKRPKVSAEELHRELATQQEEDNEEEKAREKLRRERTLLQAAQEVKEQRALAGESQHREAAIGLKENGHADESEIRIKANQTCWLNRKLNC